MSARNKAPDTPDATDTLGVVDAALAILQAAPDYFGADVEWLEERKTIWADRNWRIALIGVTSSGKSALLNAVLGQKLLPVGVAPSSSRHIYCHHGSVVEATIHFGGGRISSIRGGAVAETLARYGTEKGNPENTHGVYDIEVASPDFLLDGNVGLVDTPGLDAYNLGKHEELTMGRVLPTVDMVIYLTTTKANSDQQNLQAIGNVIKENKPVIVVLNKIDAIRAKTGAGGVEIKDRDEVLAEHVHRVKALLGRLPHQELRSSSICPFSATWALDPSTRSRSGIDNLKLIVADTVRGLEPELWRGRLRQVCTHLTVTLQAEQELLAGKSALEALGAQTISVERGAQGVEAAKRTVLSQATTVRQERSRLDEEASTYIDRMRSRVTDESTAEAVLVEFRGVVDRYYDAVSGMVAKVQSAVAAAATTLNLRSEDYELRPLEHRPV